MAGVPHPIRPEVEGDEKRFEADLVDMKARPQAWGMQQTNADELYERMSLVGGAAAVKSRAKAEAKAQKEAEKEKAKKDKAAAKAKLKADAKKAEKLAAQ